MRRVVLLSLLLPLIAEAAITGTTCTTTVQTGCVVVPLYQYTQARSVSVQVSGTWVGTLEFEGSNDGTTYYRLKAYPVPNGAFVSSTVNNGAWIVDGAGLSWMRVRASDFVSGSASVSAQPSISSPWGTMEVSGTLPITGTVALSTATVTALGPQACTHGGVRRLSIGATPEAVPNNLPDGGSGALSGRTMLLLQNVDANHDVACRFDPGDGGVPDCAVPGYGLTVFPRARYVELPARDTDKMVCVACTGSGVALEYLERSCVR